MSINSELAYECLGLGKCFDTRCSYFLDQCRHIDYSLYLINCEHCFGCVGLKNAKYHILNQPYKKDEYFKKRSKIIERMKSQNIWGSFFPLSFSPHTYEESMAGAWYPLPKKEIQNKGYHAEKLTVRPLSEKNNKETLTCSDCQTPYKTISQEIEFYQKFKLPLPKKCPKCRYLKRQKLRNPRQLWERPCSECEKNIKTTYAPERTEKVFCEECYYKIVN
jgi:hypothetical protein